VRATTAIQDRARKAVYAVGTALVLLTLLAAGWLIARDRETVHRNAALHLDNFAVVLAEHARRLFREGTFAELALVRGTGPLGPEMTSPLNDLQAKFGALYGSLELGYSGRILLFRKDGTLLAAVPELPGGLGRSYGAHPVFAYASQAGEAGALQGRGIVERDPRLVAFRKIKDFPALVVISSTVDELLAPWRRAAVVIGAGAALVALIMLAGTLLLARQLRLTGALSQEILNSETRLNSIITSAMDAIITVDEQQKIILFNAAAERTFACSASEALGFSLDRFIPERYRASHREHVRRFGEQGTTVRRMGGELVLSGLRANGLEFPIDASISHTTVGGRKFYTVILRDVTERQVALEREQEAQRDLQESEQRLQSIIGSAMDAIITIDDEQKIVLFNTAAEKIFRCAAADAMGTSINRFLPERYRAPHPEFVSRFGEAGVTMRRMGGELVLSGLRADGEEFPIDASISHVMVGGRKFYTVILRDVTARQKAAEALNRSNQELREIYGQMHQVREAERTRIARELHDELAQWLTALKMDVSWIASRLPAQEQALMTRTQRMKGVVDNTVAAVRRIAADLRPVMLDDLGFVPAIENLLYELSERAGIMVSLQGDKEDIDVQEPLATAVYRMVQEALTNVARHSGAKSVEVKVLRSAHKLYVSVRDNGKGLKPDPNRKSYGLLGIRERARTLGGDARIYSPPEGGTVVEIEVPLEMHTAQGAVT
jgi:PAS domain S-box-containing protein